MKPTLVLAAVVAAGLAHADDAPRPEGHDVLQRLVGTWTIEGREGRYTETCGWYHGERHVVCHTESRRQDGTISHSMSILAHVAGQGYVYTGIGADGRYETFRGGTFEDGVLEYNDATEGERVRIRIGPFTEPDRVPFRVHVSKDGKAWTEADAFNYRRLK
jgi:hypothetical protein